MRRFSENTTHSVFLLRLDRMVGACCANSITTLLSHLNSLLPAVPSAVCLFYQNAWHCAIVTTSSLLFENPKSSSTPKTIHSTTNKDGYFEIACSSYDSVCRIKEKIDRARVVGGVGKDEVMKPLTLSISLSLSQSHQRGRKEKFEEECMRRTNYHRRTMHAYGTAPPGRPAPPRKDNNNYYRLPSSLPCSQKVSRRIC
jgi:hypothetical protein